MPDQTNRDRIRWLQTRSKELQAIIESQQLDSELQAYMTNAAEKKQVMIVDDAEWDVLLESERRQKLIPYYHCLRTELLILTKRAEEPTSLERVTKFLDSPWIRVALATATLAEVARLLLHMFSSGGHFIGPPDEDSEGHSS